jgi:predicted Fe-S protein YdhL (DUF1289 family)
MMTPLGYPDARSLREAALKGQPVPSPCIAICRIEASTGLCEGCVRTLEEIATWGSLSGLERADVWARIETRRAQAPNPPPSR